MKKDHVLYAAAIITGVLVWAVISSVSGRSEAWDSEMYFAIGIPLICIVAAHLAYIEPERPWRWAMTPFAAQAVWMLFTVGAGNLLPIGLVLFAMLAIPALLTAKFGAYLGRRSAGSRAR